MDSDIESVLISEEQLSNRIAELATEINKAYEGSERGLVIVAVLSGSMIFLADLIRRLPIKLEIGLVSVSSYRGRTIHSLGAELEALSVPELRNRDVLIVDDILDSGRTLRLVQGRITEEEPHAVRTAVLLRKPDKAPSDVQVDFIGFDVEDQFVVGYGLDFDGHYRNLPYIGTLRPHLLPSRSD
ncbi:MAG: hypoxanthine phosphoribosyltransferase [Planctomycetota bacterium]|jgi:hypoxanthine phosphoribosyltransferase